MSKEYTIRVMTLEDYDEVYALWMGIHGFGIRSIDDSKEGVERFLKRNPTTSMVAVADGKIVGAILCGLLPLSAFSDCDYIFLCCTGSTEPRISASVKRYYPQRLLYHRRRKHKNGNS